MTIILLLIINIFLVLSLSAFFDSGTRNRWFIKRNYSCFLEGFARLELNGWRVRDVSIVTWDGKIRRTLYLKLSLVWSLIFFTVYLCLLIQTYTWVSSILIFCFFIIGLIPVSEILSLREWIDKNGESELYVSKPSFYTIIALILLFCGIEIINRSIYLNFRTNDIGLALVYLSVGLIFIMLSTRILRKSRKISLRELDYHIEEATLYLRSFSHDNLRIRIFDTIVGHLSVFLGYNSRFEEFIAASKDWKNSLIAIGAPGEKYPQLGAIRTYVTDENWKTYVNAIASRVKSIYVIAGFSDGLIWEIDHLTKWKLQEKTLIIIPPFNYKKIVPLLSKLFNQLSIDLGNFDEPNDLIYTLSHTLTGIGMTHEGKYVFYVSDGRDAMSYMATITLFNSIQSGDVKPLAHGILAQQMGYEIDAEKQ